MSWYIIKTKQRIEVQENDDIEIPFTIDALLPFDSEFTLSIFKKSTRIINKVGGVKDVGNRKVTFSFRPTDTNGFSQFDLYWELEMKTTDNKYYTIGQGDFVIHKTFITND